MKKIITMTAMWALALVTAWGGTTLDVNVDKPVSDVAPTMYGIFFEDINFAADGGLYAEKVKNRSFEFPQTLMGWETFGNVEVKDDGPFERAPHYVTLKPASHHEKQTGLTNEGYFGVSFEKDEPLRFSVWARLTKEGKPSTIRVELVEPASMNETQVMAKAELEVNSTKWTKYECTLNPLETVKKGKLRIFLWDNRPVDLEHVSLFPVDTYRGRSNGLRRDLAEKLEALHPGVLRFPGGCIVEGTERGDRYQWKNTVGPVENRPTNLNRWEYCFPKRYYPDYHQSYGLGFFEFFQLAEDIGAEPLPILNVGLVCQFQNDDPRAHFPVDSLQELIQDAVDLVEFANGDTSTTWGGLRARMGHPAPFNLKYMGIGNEQWDTLYTQRLEPFLKEMRAKHPEIKIVGSSGPYSGGEMFDFLWPEMRRLGADLVDEHYYAPESWMLKNADRYDKYPRKGPKVFAGEYACHGADHKKFNHFNASLCEAAMMTGLERNADIVRMATYAPLFAHVEGWQWRPDMIWYDNLESFPTASYYVQQLYSLNKGTQVLKATDGEGKPLTGQEGLYATVAYDEPTGEYIVKAVNVTDEPQELTVNFQGKKKKVNLTEGSLTVLTADEPMAENTLENPGRVVPQTTQLQGVSGQTLRLELGPKSLNVARAK